MNKSNPEKMQRAKPIPAPGTIILKTQKLEKTFVQAGKTLNVLQDVNIKIEAGEIVALVGPSGSGKSTLLQLLGLLDKPTSGQIVIGDKLAGNLNDQERTKLRLQSIGFVYQFHHLLPEFNAQENVAFPQIIKGISRRAALKEAAEIMDTLGLSERLTHRPGTLSGGEQQRVAIARALANKPQLLFADEPTGNLDPETSAEVFEILLEQVRKRGLGALIATHNLDLADQMDRILELKAGRIAPF